YQPFKERTGLIEKRNSMFTLADLFSPMLQLRESALEGFLACRRVATPEIEISSVDMLLSEVLRGDGCRPALRICNFASDDVNLCASNSVAQFREGEGRFKAPLKSRLATSCFPKTTSIRARVNKARAMLSGCLRDWARKTARFWS